LSDSGTGNCRHSRNQRFLPADPVIDGCRGAHVLHDAADIRRQSARRYLPVGDELNQLIFPARRIDRWYLLENQSVIGSAAECLRHREQCFGLVALDGNKAAIDVDRVQQYLCAGDDAVRMYLGEPMT